MKSVIRVMTKVTIITLASLFSLGAYASEHSEGLTCESKKQTIETQIDYAKKNNNSHQVQGLEKALHDVNNYCSNDELETKYKLKVIEKTKKLAEKNKELTEKNKAFVKHNRKSDQEKIAKLKTKLSEAEQELVQAKQNLAGYYNEIKTR
ncbi:DUF1090 domain-containing protein [Gilliamella sp. Pas-s25]|uniref:DUF1090 domain-containing protein n=1 Tax=Gilliamella sp. Pas-s25 TaxID=2687310 RepID=UPI00135EEF08|nr:DUF1090 domain-containing protein [Gilliamella sp. Pas-s25]MWP62961.1 DUF1090 family protein [Gilliamella sp. Pas-s25]